MRPIRYDFPGMYHHIMNRGNKGEEIFQEKDDYKYYLEVLKRSQEEFDFNLICYCLMTNHLHLLVQTGRVHLSRIMQGINTIYTKYFNKKYGVKGHVFQGRYKSIIIQKDPYLVEVSRYIHLNPVYARVVKRPEDYRWSSYREYIGRGGEGIITNRIILGMISGDKGWSQSRYKEFVEDRLKEKESRYPGNLIKQMILGEKLFAEKILKSSKQERRKEGVRKKEGKISKERIIDYVCKRYHLDSKQMKGPKKKRNLVRTREIMIYLLRRLAHLKSREIGRLMGIAPATVSRNCLKAWEKIKSGEQEYKEIISRIISE